MNSPSVSPESSLPFGLGVFLSLSGRKHDYMGEKERKTCIPLNPDNN